MFQFLQSYVMALIGLTRIVYKMNCLQTAESRSCRLSKAGLDKANVTHKSRMGLGEIPNISNILIMAAVWFLILLFTKVVEMLLSNITIQTTKVLWLIMAETRVQSASF